MSRTAFDFLFRVEAPYLSMGAEEEGYQRWNPGHFYSAPGIDSCVRQLRGGKMRTVGALMNEFGAALQFFGEFGENWHALEECLSYLDEWLPAGAYVLVVENVEELLADEPDSLGAFLETVNAAGDFWAKPVVGNGRFDRDPVPFHLLMHLSGGGVAAASRIRAAAATVGIEVRTP